MNLEQDRRIKSLVFSPDDAILAASVYGDGSPCISLWDMASRAKVRTLEVPDPNSSDVIFEVSFSNSVREPRLASASWDGHIRLWDTSSGQCTHKFYAAKNRENHVVNSVAFFSDGSKVMCSSNGMLQVWDIRSGERVGSYDHGEYVVSITVSPDQTSLAYVDQNSSSVFMIDTKLDSETCAELKGRKAGQHEYGSQVSPRRVIFVRNGTCVVGGTSVGLWMWDIKTKLVVWSVDSYSDGACEDIAVSPDETTIISGKLAI